MQKTKEEKQKIAALYTVWESRKSGNKCMIVGYCNIPELNSKAGIIVASNQDGKTFVNVFRAEKFVELFKPVDT